MLRADEVIDYRSTNVVERIEGNDRWQGLPVVFDTVGGDVFLQSIDCAAVNGQVVTHTRCKREHRRSWPVAALPERDGPL